MESNLNTYKNNDKINSGRKFSWVKRLMKNANANSGSSGNTPGHGGSGGGSARRTGAGNVIANGSTASTSMPRRHQLPLASATRTAVDPNTASGGNATNLPISFDATSCSSIISSTDMASRIPILSLSSQSIASSSLGSDSQQSTTATSVLPTTATTPFNLQSNNYIHINPVHNHALDDCSIVTLLSSNRRCRSFDSNTNLSTLGIPPLSIIERHGNINNIPTNPGSPALMPLSNRSSALFSGFNLDGGSIKTSWTIDKNIGEEQ